MSDRFIVGLPWWAKRLDELSGHFTAHGLGGLLDHHEVTNSLGVALAYGVVTPEMLKAWLDDQKRQQAPTTAATNPLDGRSVYNSDPRAFWEQCWEMILGRKIEIPAIPKMKGKTKKAIERYKLMLVFLSSIDEDDYPKSFVKPAWGCIVDTSEIELKPLPGRWVLTETIKKPSYDDGNGYGEDPLGADLNLEARFKISWDHLTATIMPASAKLLGLASRAVRQPTAEEWNLIGNLFNWLKANRNMDLPDLGSTNSWEWCLNAYGSAGERLIVGDCACGGLSGVRSAWPDLPNGGIAFRVLAVL